MAKNDAELQALEQPKSRNEEYLNFLCGRAVDINSLPDKPYSRVEHYLEYLCYNGGIGGGGGANPFVGLTDAVINNNIITFQKNDGTTVQVDLNELNTRINNIVPTQGNINLGLRQVGDSIRLQVEGQDAGVIDLAGFVKSVNNIAPVVGANGNITLNAEHMNYDDVNTQLGVRTVQEAIEVLKDNIDLIDTADIHIVANETELNNLLAQGVLKKSDIIYIIDSTGVVDYDNVNVNNGTNPVAMIYDDGVVGNHLRVFSKVVPTINLNASNVSFDSNNVDGVTANNVQTAIEEVNRKFVSNVSYDATDRSLKQTKDNQESTLVTGIVTKWGDLEHTTQSTTLKNIFDKTTQVEDNKQYYFGSIRDNQEWKIIKVPCSVGKEYTITKGIKHDSQQFGVYDSNGTLIHNGSTTSNKLINGRMTYKLTIPVTATDATYFVTSLFKVDSNENDVMVFEGNLTDDEIPVDYIPFMDGASVLVDSNEVALTFDKTGTSLISVTVHSAIKELDKKIVNAGGGTVTSVNGVNPNPQGNVTVGITDITGLQGQLDGKVSTSEVGNEANKIPRIDGTGKLDTSIIPDLAITDVHIVANEQEVMNLNVQKGDVVVVENGPQHQNQTFMCKNHTATTQNDKFIAINMGYPVVKKINNIFPDQVGAMTLNATHIDCTINNDTKSTQVHLSNIGNGLRNVDQRVTNNTNRISALENRKLTVQAGDIITTIKNNGNAYTVGGATFLHCGIRKTISRAQYPQLADALGIPTGINNFEYPYIQDTNINYDNGQRNATRRTYICAHVR